jgi:peptide/nickel transport system ATP-binding protein
MRPIAVPTGRTEGQVSGSSEGKIEGSMTEARSAKPALLEVQELKTGFQTERGWAWAVNGVSFSIERGKTLCLVGESGCGKTVTGLSILRLVPSPPGRIVSGRIRLDGTELLDLPEKDMRRIRGNRISMIFQEPMTSLNPVFTVGSQVEEAIRLHQKVSRGEARKRAIEMFGRVGLPSPEQTIRDYPNQLSGGMRQRVMIAMALSCHPDVLIADEPTTALDVTIQAQILDLMSALQKQMGMAILFITHDLGIVAQIADEVAIMYAGKIVEHAPVVDLYDRPRHPYTVGLLRSVPKPRLGEGERRRLDAIPGAVPDLARLPAGCSYQDRCPWVFEKCRREEPPLLAAGQGTAAGRRRSACWRWEDL